MLPDLNILVTLKLPTSRRRPDDLPDELDNSETHNIYTMPVSSRQ